MPKCRRTTLSTYVPEVPITVAGAGGVITAAAAAAGVLVVVAGTRVDAEGDVEAGHVVGHVAVEVEQHGPGLAHYLGHRACRVGLVLGLHQAGVVRLDKGTMN